MTAVAPFAPDRWYSAQQVQAGAAPRPRRPERNNTHSSRGTGCSGNPYRWGHSWYRRGAWGRSLYAYNWDRWNGYWWGTPRWYSPYRYYQWW